MIGDTLADQPAHPPQQAFFFDKSRNQTAFYNGVEWSVRGTVAIKAFDQVLNGYATLSDDPELRILVVHNSKFALDSQIIYDSSTTADIKFAWSAPLDATLEWTTNGLGSGATTGNGSLTVSNASIADVLVAGGIGVGTQVTAAARGILTVASTPGEFFLRWAQNVSDPTNTTIHKKSWISLTRIA
jgi:hypothetical protein